MGKRRVVASMTVVAVAVLGAAGPAQAAAVHDPRDTPGGVDVRRVGIWHSGSSLVLTVQYHEPVPADYDAEFSARLGRNCRSGSHQLAANLAMDDRFADIFGVTPTVGPEFANHRTTVFRFTDPALRGQDWRCASDVVLESWVGGTYYLDTIRNLRV